jgi:hypothetical protein
MNMIKKCKLKEFWTEEADGETLICFRVRRGRGFEIKRYTFEEIAEESNRKLKRRRVRSATCPITQMPA